jgi:TolB protein
MERKFEGRSGAFGTPGFAVFLAFVGVALTLVFSTSGRAHVAAGSGSGAFPGRNGEILFSSLRVPNGHVKLYLMRPDGTHKRLIARAPLDVGPATWSPNGKWIAYNRTRPPGGVCPQLYLMRADGTRVRRLAHDRWCYNNPAWSPDGRRMAFQRFRGTGVVSKFSIWSMNVNGTGLRRLTDEDDNSPAWSPDGTTIAFERDPGHIWLMDADGSNQRPLTTPPDGAPVPDSGPDWSPNGSWIAFTREHEPHEGRSGGTRYREDIYVIRTDGTGLKRLTRRAGVNFGPVWSPNGKWIVFSSDRAHEDLMDVYVMNADGRRQKRLTKGPVDHYSQDWRPRP